MFYFYGQDLCSCFLLEIVCVWCFHMCRIYMFRVNVTQTVPDISPLMPMHQDPLLVTYVFTIHIHRCDCKPMPTSTCEANTVLTFSTFNSARCTTSRCHNQLLCQISSVLRKNMRGVPIPQISWSFVTTTTWVEIIFINKGTHTFPKKSKYFLMFVSHHWLLKIFFCFNYSPFDKLGISN